MTVQKTINENSKVFSMNENLLYFIYSCFNLTAINCNTF